MLQNLKHYDKIIIGAGLYGLYAALYCAKKGQGVLVLEADEAPFSRATYVNQARVHNGYHYPRSLSTAVKSAGYFRRFYEDFGFCIHERFSQIYATSAQFSWTNAAQFQQFCKAAGILCREVPVSEYFRDGMCDGAFLTEEYTYDAAILRDYFIDELQTYTNVEIRYGILLEEIRRDGGQYVVNSVSNRSSQSGLDGTGDLPSSETFAAPFVLNASYASVNQVLSKVRAGVIGTDDMFPLKYELCEIILVKPSEQLRGVGLTVMDGPFFSIMPFGKTGLHSLTAVTFTPHTVSYADVPEFPCQKELAEYQASRMSATGTVSDGMLSRSEGKPSSEDDRRFDKNFSGISICDKNHLDNCNLCPVKPESSFAYMSHLADKYLKPEYRYEYADSLYSMKPILKSSEIDDSRPTAIRVHSKSPTLLSVLSGKINTVYDLEEYLDL